MDSDQTCKQKASLSKALSFMSVFQIIHWSSTVQKKKKVNCCSVSEHETG